MQEPKRYNHKAIEAKWQKFWMDNRSFKADATSKKPKYYVLDMFPFPSGAGLHVGHVEGYTATDIVARYKRQRGFEVLHPMGWDSFGLPAEQYAIRTGTHPAETTRENIDNFRRQLQSLGFSYDWDREFATSDPSYYKWTQWIFTKLYEKGLAYVAEMPVNYCPVLGTVLANEEIENGLSKVGGHPVERRPLKQWILKITAYAERLLADLDLLDWPDSLKKLQINWIGKSVGAQIDFAVESIGQTITVFSTCPDTLFGATYLVLAPEHPLVKDLTQEDRKEEVATYIKEVASRSEIDRSDQGKKKSGVFLGSYAINPANGKLIPIWIADYVLMGYGTGAIMAVPAHDERDFEFASLFKLPIIPVYDPNVASAKDKVSEESNPEEVRREVLNGQRCWPWDGTSINSRNESVSLEGMNVAKAKETMIVWLEQHRKGKRHTSYKLRDWLFSRQRYWGEPFPVLTFEDGSKRLLEVDELPLTLPDIREYKPSGDGSGPLSQLTDWVYTTDPKTGKPSKRETDTMPNWAGSCWYYLRFCDPHNAQHAWRPDLEKRWLPVDLYIGGVEHAVLHLLYARFWHKVLYDCGYVSTLEPFQKLRNQGLIVARSYQLSSGAYVEPSDVYEKDGKYYHRQTHEELRSQVEKMSKSKLNGVIPDQIIEEFGADSLRLYEMFMGPLEKEKIWNTDAVNGCRRFLNRFFDIVNSDKVCDEESVEALKLGHRLVHYATQDTEALLFNTAIAKMMEFVNEFIKLPAYPRSVLKMATQVLSPYAPHLAEEAWEILGGEGELMTAPYPIVDPALLEDPTITYVVQVNGKVRGKFDLPKDQTEENVLQAANKIPAIQRYLDGKTLQKVVFVPNKLLSLVVGEGESA